MDYTIEKAFELCQTRNRRPRADVTGPQLLLTPVLFGDISLIHLDGYSIPARGKGTEVCARHLTHISLPTCSKDAIAHCEGSWDVESLSLVVSYQAYN